MANDPSFANLLLTLGYAAGSLSRPELFTQLAESLQNGNLNSGHVVFLRDTLTRALQLASVEPCGPSDLE